MRIRFVPAVIAFVIATIIGTAGSADAEPRQLDRSFYMTDETPFLQIDLTNIDAEFDENGNPITPLGVAVVELYENHRAIGAVNDGMDAFYAPIGDVVELGTGTATVTAEGLAFCVDGETGRCTGSEFDPWASDSEV